MKVKGLKFCIIILSFLSCALNFLGCVSAPVVTPPKIEGMPGVYHRVESGQTLWRISKLYNIDLNELVSINHISDATNIETGQLIFIPHFKTQPQLPSFKSTLEDFIWPVRGKVIASFGETFNKMINKGINIEIHRDTDVVASRSGKVIFYSPDFKGYGKTIIIDHGDGFQTVYARNSQVFIKAGDTVNRGALIAKVASGASTTRAKINYLHFEIRKGHVPQNPFFYLSR